MFFKFIMAIALFATTIAYGDNIGLLIVATGKYIQFVDPLVASAEKHFCSNHNVTYFVFTDTPRVSDEKVVYHHQDKLGWPFDTMMRYHMYLSRRELLESQDYLFACDADMLFVDEIGDEILGERVAAMHPGFVGKRGTYETNPFSKAYVGEDEGECYFAGGFYGGSAKEVLNIAEVNSKNIDEDLQNGLIAVWHDESHWNRYCIDHKPTVILNPSYCYPESWNMPYPPKLLALDKNHDEVRAN